MSDSQSASILVGRSAAPVGARGEEPRAPAETGPEPGVNLAPFLSLARELASNITPVQARRAFRDDLHRDLVAVARQQYAYNQLFVSEPAANQGRNNRRWVLGAATLGSAVSLAGVAAYVWRQRHRQAA